MSEMESQYLKDSRITCKYGVNCYQKNPEHHKKYKHPPLKRKNFHCDENEKRIKISNEDENKPDKPELTSELSEPSPSRLDVEAMETKSKNCESIPANITYYDQNAPREIIKELFLMAMPLDFFKFYESLSKEDKGIENILSAVNLELIGPYDFLLGKLPKLEDKELYLIHWRFFYDPPEFQAVLKKKGQEYHIGYFRDSPNEMPVFVGANDSSKDCRIIPLAQNIFASVYLYLQNEKKRSLFTSMACTKLMEKVKKLAEEHKYSLEPYNMKNRLSQIVTRSFHGAGIIVPYNKKTQLGYRPLVESDANLKKIFAKLSAATNQSDKDKILSELQPVITFANIAVDECDFGTGLEAGINLFCSGLKELEASALSCLQSVYSLLNRDAFSKIIEVHLKNRRKGPNMSILNLS